MTTSSTNNSVFRGFFEKQKLIGPNFIDWYRQLRIVLSIKDKLNYLEQSIPPVPVAPAGQQVAPEILAAHTAWVKGSKEIEEGQSVSSYILKMKGYIENLERLWHPVTLGLSVSLILIGLRKECDGFVQNYNMHSMGKIVNVLHAMLKLHEQTLPKSNAPAINAIRAGKVQNGNKHKKSHSQKGSKGQNQRKGKFAPKPKIPPPPKRENPAKDSICHESSGAGGLGIFVIELNTILNRSWIYDTGCGTHIFNTTQGLRASNKLKPGALSLYVGNGQREAVEAIGAFYLCLPSGLEIVLNNCHYAPSITRGVISFSRLYEDGFVNRFVDNKIQVSRNNVVYFCAIPRDGIFEIDLSNSLTNESSVYAVSNKRAKLDLDSALLWHWNLKNVSLVCLERWQGNLTHIKEQATSSPSLTTSVIDMVRSMMSQTTLPKYFWDYALETAASILNMFPTKKVEKTPYGVWHRKASKLSYLKVWGCEALIKRDTLTKPDKLEPRSIKCIFVGYPKETMGYSFYYPPENKVRVARNAEFLGNSLIDQEASGSLDYLEIVQKEDTHPSLDTSLNHEEENLEIDKPQSDIILIRRSTRTRHAPDRMCLYIDVEEHELGHLGELANYKAALLDPDKWLFKKKTDMDGNVHIYKARLVAKGFTQTPGIDYEETFSPVVDIRAIRILIAIAAYYDYEIWQMDVKTAFPNRYLNEEVYKEQPDGFVNSKYPNRVCKLKRSIYGLKQASRQWNKRFDDEIKRFGFTQNYDEPCVYIKSSGSNITFLILYVDDILIMGNSITMLQTVKTHLEKCFAMKDLGEAAYILGIKIYQDRSKRLIGLCQSAYIEKILKRYCMENSKRGSIPMQEKLKLKKSQGDIHWTTVKNILKYLRNTKDMFLFYGGDIKRELRVSCYTDAGCLTDADDLKSPTGYVFVLNGGVVDWKSAKQSIFATSSAEAEFIDAFDESKEAMEMHRLRELSEKVVTDNFYGTYNEKVKEALGRVKARLSKMLQEAACGRHEVVINSWRD
nr:hypothetical protein [Tanacetum cinerariifolium]